MVNLIVVLLKGTSLHVDSTLNFKKKKSVQKWQKLKEN